MTYIAEIRLDESKLNILETAEMKILSRITAKILHERERSEGIKRVCEIEKWNAYIERMEQNRVDLMITYHIVLFLFLLEILCILL